MCFYCRIIRIFFLSATAVVVLLSSLLSAKALVYAYDVGGEQKASATPERENTKKKTPSGCEKKKIRNRSIRVPPRLPVIRAFGRFHREKSTSAVGETYRLPWPDRGRNLLSRTTDTIRHVATPVDLDGPPPLVPPFVRSPGWTHDGVQRERERVTIVHGHSG